MTKKPIDHPVHISFTLRNQKEKCQLLTRWGGCCCQCMYHGEVFKQCMYSEKHEQGCICNKSLGFYVCTVGHAIQTLDTERRIHVIGEHGFCEMYTHKTQPQVSIDFTSWWYKNCVKQRRNKAKICGQCPYRSDIESQEAIRKDEPSKKEQ